MLVSRYSEKEEAMTERESARSGISKSEVQSSQSNGLVNMEMNCLICGRRLYVPDASIEVVLASLEQAGVVILICPGGHAQLICRKKPPSRQLHA